VLRRLGGIGAGVSYLNGFIGFGFILLALLHLGVPDGSFLIGAYLLGSALAFTTLVRRLSLNVSRLLALATTAATFFYFIGFFQMAPHLGEGWYAVHTKALGQLLGAFAMIPVLAEYSCRLKADCREAMEGHRIGFFSAPRKLGRQVRI